MKKILLPVLTMLLLGACNTNTKAPAPVAVEPVPAQAKDSSLFANVHFDSKWDLSCGMPISAGLEDTAHYKGKIYGFCSKECKDGFLKDPETALRSKK